MKFLRSFSHGSHPNWRVTYTTSVSLAMLLFTGCGGDAAVVTEPSNPNAGAAVATKPVTNLSSEEIAALKFMREEEKLANNVYKLLGTTWAAQTRVFTNIANSEASHTEAIRQLLVRYTLADPAANLADGVFQNQTLQQLYNSLIAQGTLS